MMVAADVVPRPSARPDELATACAGSGADNVEAELGVTVRSDRNVPGLANCVPAKMIDSVKRRGTQRIVRNVLRENEPMRALASRFGSQIERQTVEHGSLRQVVVLQPGQDVSGI